MKLKELKTPKTEGYDLAAFSAPAATLGPDNTSSPIGSVARSQINKTKPKGKKNGRTNQGS